MSTMALGPELLCPHSKRLNSVARRRLREALATRRGTSNPKKQAPQQQQQRQQRKQRASSSQLQLEGSCGGATSSRPLSRAPSCASHQEDGGTSPGFHVDRQLTVTTDSVLCDAVLEGLSFQVEPLRLASMVRQQEDASSALSPPGGSGALHQDAAATGWVVIDEEELASAALDEYILVPHELAQEL